MKIEVIDAKPYHCGQMIRHLRIEHRKAIETTGIEPHRELRGRFDTSAYRKALLIDEKLVALGGCTGMLMEHYGYVWLAVTSQAARYPIVLIREMRAALRDIMESKVEIATTILGGDEAAQRLAVFLGFHVEDEGPGQAVSTKHGRKTLSRHLDTTPELRIPVGRGYAVAMGYHAE